MQLYWAAQVTFLPADFAAVRMLNLIELFEPPSWAAVCPPKVAARVC